MNQTAGKDLLEPSPVTRLEHFLAPRLFHVCFCILKWQAHASREQVPSKGAVMKRALFWGTIVAGAVAAYLMYRRGESMGAIAVRTVTNPVGSLVSELQTASD
jgi:hypothetical protein